MQNVIKTQKEILDRVKTEKALFQLKDFFKKELSDQLNLMEVSAPIAVTSGTGINDDLTGIENPIRFLAKSYPDRKLEIVQSLAKWKRLKIGELEIPVGKGIITDMRALRPDEIISPIHSIFVDQWDWEKHISKTQRNLDFLKVVVEKIYGVIKDTERFISNLYPALGSALPDKITFIHTEELQYRYPKLTPRERENVVAKDHGAVFILDIGHELTDGVPHDLRAPDYDDWSTPTTGKYRGLNGDIIIWNPVLESAFEITSMGIRVDKKALLNQLKLTNTENRLELRFHKCLINDELPLTVGGGIGQSRLAMFLLKKRNISEVQALIF